MAEPPTTRDRQQAGLIRADTLAHVRLLADRGDYQAILPYVFDRRNRDHAVGALRLWRLDQAMFAVTRPTAIATVRQAASWAGRDMQGGYPDVDWVLAWRGLRLDCWLLAMTIRETRLPGPDPYQWSSEAPAVPSLQ